MTTPKLQHELKKKRPFESPEEEALLSVVRTSDQLQIRSARLLREHGLTPSQYNILRILRGEGKPLPILEIASRTITVVPGITGLIDRLERAGFVHRLRCEKDRRVIYVALTDRGTKTLADLDEPLLALHRKLMGRLSQGESKELIRLLEKVTGVVNPNISAWRRKTVGDFSAGRSPMTAERFASSTLSFTSTRPRASSAPVSWRASLKFATASWPPPSTNSSRLRSGWKISKKMAACSRKKSTKKTSPPW